MYELRQVGAHSWYVDCPARVGIYDAGGEAVLIDSGSSRDVAKKLLRLLEGLHLPLRTVINTHSHADHTGGSALLQRRTGCAVYAPGVESVILSHPELEPATLYGGFPPQTMRGHALMAEKADCRPLDELAPPPGLRLCRLDGHAMEQVAVGTDDGVWFVGDALTGAEILEKYRISFLYDAAAYLRSLETLATLEGTLFIPAHAEPQRDLHALIGKNRDAVLAVQEALLAQARTPLPFDELIGRVFDAFGLHMSLNQYALAGSTLRSHIACLCDAGRMAPVVEGNRLLWQTVE